jgi:hypothetical protein
MCLLRQELSKREGKKDNVNPAASQRRKRERRNREKKRR